MRKDNEDDLRGLKVEFLQSMQVLDLKDDDIVVVRHPSVLSTETAVRIRSVFMDMFKNWGLNVHVIVFDEGMDIGILIKED